MNIIVLLLIFSAIFFPYAESLDCYSCLSTYSWKDCDSKRFIGTCIDGLDKCSKYHAKGRKLEYYIRGCKSSYQCDHKTACNRTWIRRCEVNCCFGTLCNGSPNKLPSAYFLTACALFALFPV